MSSCRLVCFTPSGSYSLDECLYFHFTKERYTPYTLLEGRWFCESDNFDEITSVVMTVDDNCIHYGYPCAAEIQKQDGRTVLCLSSRSYTDALAKNQPTAGLVSSVDLQTLANSAVVCPNVLYESGTPVVSYVNYYDGTTIWDAVCCYAIRATGLYPYIRGANTVRVSRPTDAVTLTTYTNALIKRESGTNYANLISDISESDVSGNPSAYVISDNTAYSKNIVRKKEIPFDREWIMDPLVGLNFRINYAKRAMLYDSFTLCGYWQVDLLDYLVVNDLPFVGEISKIEIIGSASKPIISTFTCYHDAYCA